MRRMSAGNGDSNGCGRPESDARTPSDERAKRDVPLARPLRARRTRFVAFASFALPIRARRRSSASYSALLSLIAPYGP